MSAKATTKVVKLKPQNTMFILAEDWGNPYAIGIDGDRDEVIRKYQYDFERGYLKSSNEQLLALRSKTLG